ncbi:ECF transporter S component [Lachnoclostridium sp. An14]|mgnify:CR=1 FL=1|uniref:ECF transporter S component n=1 Tax=Lachnoclostridium sp. An14 TaxID=1965562 RepID=UPI000B3A53C6|nr:ECF transporter S component [Lachnoclostridium sp. An14]OUQ16812.1 ECF transporter S component [Lachnoclostridium sp. An14]
MSTKTKRITMVGMLCAIAFLVTVVCRIPVVLFLKYEPKDVIVTMGGFMFGPMTSFVVSLIVSFVEMFTISDTGIIGCIMNVLSTCSFACTAAFIYKKHHTFKGAVAGLISGCLLATAVMLLWNYLITPIYMGYPREAVKALLVPAFLPFNLLKGGVNMALTLLVYKPVVTALRRGGLLEDNGSRMENKTRSVGPVLVSGLLLITCVFFGLVLKGVV